MQSKITLAVDIMGGDLGPSATLPACSEFLNTVPNIFLRLYGLSEVLFPWYNSLSQESQSRVYLQHCPEVVLGTTSVKDALRHLKLSSMRLSILSVKEGLSGACVSSGNTGALVALAKVLLQTLPSIERPALARAIPSVSPNGPGFFVMLDLGGNVDCTPEQLLGFALIGNDFYNKLTQNPKYHPPKIKLLNIGSESHKGNLLLRQAASLFETDCPHFEGFIEADQLYASQADIVVCDGFCGNIALKAMEGTANLFLSQMKAATMRNLQSQIGGFLLKSALTQQFSAFRPEKNNGAPILGLQGLVIKSHGASDAKEFYQALCFAKDQIIAQSFFNKLT